MKRADQRKHHYIYRITRTDGSGKYYIGMHSTDNLDDGYFGSGSLLSRSIKKHGRENHIKEILEYLPSREALKLREKEFVSEEILGDKLCMNLKLGGDGGFDHLNTPAMRHQKVLAAKKGREAFGKKLREDPDFAKRFGEMSAATFKAAHAAGKIKYDTFTGRKHSEETKQKMREARKLYGHQKSLAQGTSCVHDSGYDDE